MQKDVLGQDVFLIGPPGPLKRLIAMQYLELTTKEVEYLALSRDTTESDIKQRREIRSKTAQYIDQCAVRAAVEGRVLVLEGIEKAERNVLPVINNLLENREMQLEDGRFLMAAQRYDKLLEEHSKEQLDNWKVTRVHEDFRVIALGLPVPQFQGNPLDPPLRSRFQARDINPVSFSEQLSDLLSQSTSLKSDQLSILLSFAYTMLSPESKSLGLPPFPLDQLGAAVQILAQIPSTPSYEIIHCLYPYDIFLSKDGQQSVTETLKRFELLPEETDADIGNNVSRIVHDLNSHSAAVTLESGGEEAQIKVMSGVRTATSHPESDWFVFTNYHQNLLSQLMKSHLVKDFCIIGPKGCGKTAVVKKFAEMLSYDVETVMLYQDMTARDLVQQRTTLENGDTVWQDAPLVTAALNGQFVILDGIHAVNAGTLAVIHRLVHDRELQLFDGKRLLRADRYDRLKTDHNLSDKDLAERGILRIHPAFRIAAVAEPPVAGSSTQQWLNAELLSLFFYHRVRPLSVNEELEIIQGTAKETLNPKMDSILRFTHKLRSTPDLTLSPIASSLSTRQLLRISRRLQKYPDESAFDAIQKACLSRFLPSLTKLALNKALEDAGICPPKDKHDGVTEDWEQSISCEVKDGAVRIGKTTFPIFHPDVKTKVPDVLFYDNTQHLCVMEDMLKDFILEEHLLLVGNQGVGKNKVVDRFLQLLCRPREYIQLHRDTTVQTLTLQPTVRDGVIVYEDSPLVRAVKLGHVLVIDEADKAPTHVTCILKTLVEAGTMILADGRKIVSTKSIGQVSGGNVIHMHPDFRMIVLANRPGFPFLGNDFFGALGDMFSCHAVDNPSFESEVAMLQKYGPDVPRPLLQKLVEAFGDLRNMADEGLISYPYSTREVVNIVKHLQMFPNEGLPTVVGNVFDFDQYNNETWDTLKKTLHKHGIPIGTSSASVSLAKEFPLPQPKIICNWNTAAVTGPGSVHLPVETRTVHRGKPSYFKLINEPMDRVDSRAQVFSEEQMHWHLPIHENNVITDVAVTKCGDQMRDLIHVTTANPITILSMSAQKRMISCIDLFMLFQETRGGYRPQVQMAPLGGYLMGHVLIHEQIVNKTFIVDTASGLVYPVHTSSFVESAVQEITDRLVGRNKGFHRMCADYADKDILIFYQTNSNCLEVVQPNAGIGYNIVLPLRIERVFPVAEDKWLVVDKNDKKKFMLQMPDPTSEYVNALYTIDEDSTLDLSGISKAALRPFALAAALGKQITAPNRIIGANDDYASIAVGFPDLQSAEIHSYARPEGSFSRNGNRPPIFLEEAGQMVNLVSESPEDNPSKQDVGCYLEVVDMISNKVRYVPIPNPITEPPYSAWLGSISPTHILTTTMSNDGLVTVDAGGCVRMWETGTVNLEHSLSEWKNMIGHDANRPIEITVDLEKPEEITEPKHGKIDPLNMPHVGGGTWAGGVGGRGTAGLGGYGGPYRLDAGHTVHQVPDHIKDAVPEEIRKAAREMARKAYKERLKQINMSEHDAELYDRFSGNIRKQVQSLRVILDSLQAKSKERQWLRHQTSGELDDMKLIEGLTGERAIYKRRGEKEPEMGATQQKPKRLKLLTDVSGSMYRFDGYDGRLQRMMEAALLVMEAFEQYDEKFMYEIIGHSGEDYEIDLLPRGQLPKNDKERLEVLKIMHAHSQFCTSGDHTLEATMHAIDNISKEEADERFVIVLSDANFDRYGIRPSSFARALTSNADVNAFAIFIGSLGDQAVRLTKALPSGRGFVCMNTQIIPDVLRQIFTSSLLVK